MKDLVSCIVAVFNGEQYLKEALDSILDQTYQPVEVIVIDDGSTDGTAAIAERYGERVRYKWQTNAGPGAARNLGLSLAAGEFVAFLDADDLWHPEKLTLQMERFHARPELEMCITHAQNFWAPELREEEVRFQDHRLSKPIPCYLTQALLARRTLFDKLGSFQSQFRHVHDSEWFLRANEQDIVTELLPDVLVYRRLHEGNRSRRLAASSRDEYLQLIKASIDRRRRQGEANSG